MGEAQDLVIASELALADSREGGSREADGFSAAPGVVGEVGASSEAAGVVVA